MTTATAAKSATGHATAGAASSRAVLLGGLVSLLGGLVVCLVAFVVADARAGLSALAGVLGFTALATTSALAVALVARVLPAASLLVALLTYTLQVVLLALVFAALVGSGWAGGAVSPRWLGAAVVTAALVWTGAQLVLLTRLREPIYYNVSEVDAR